MFKKAKFLFLKIVLITFSKAPVYKFFCITYRCAIPLSRVDIYKNYYKPFSKIMWLITEEITIVYD